MMSDNAATVAITVGFCLILAAIYIGRTQLIPNRRWGRRVYWSSFLAGTLIFTAATATSLSKAVPIIAVWAALAVFYAFVATPYLKIGDRIYAMTAANRTPETDEPERASSPERL